MMHTVFLHKTGIDSKQFYTFLPFFLLKIFSKLKTHEKESQQIWLIAFITLLRAYNFLDI